MTGSPTLLDCARALLALTELERETWVDVELVGLTQAEVARRDQVSEPCISLRIARARRKLEAYALTEGQVAA